MLVNWAHICAGARRRIQAMAGGFDQGGGDNPMLLLVSGILLLGGIAAFIVWGLTHAYPAA
jgi:hypothetical protein